MTLKQEAAERMQRASRREMEEDKLWDWLNNPACQVGYMEKEINQEFNH